MKGVLPALVATVLVNASPRLLVCSPLLKRSLAIREKALGLDHFIVAQTLTMLAGLYKDQGRYADAEALYKRSLAITDPCGVEKS